MKYYLISTSCTLKFNIPEEKKITKDWIKYCKSHYSFPTFTVYDCIDIQQHNFCCHLSLHNSSCHVLNWATQCNSDAHVRILTSEIPFWKVTVNSQVKSLLAERYFCGNLISVKSLFWANQNTYKYFCVSVCTSNSCFYSLRLL